MFLQVNVWSWENWLVFYFANKILSKYYSTVELVRTEESYKTFIEAYKSKKEIPDVNITLRNSITDKTFSIKSIDFHSIHVVQGLFTNLGILQSKEILEENKLKKYYFIINKMREYFELNKDNKSSNNIDNSSSVSKVNLGSTDKNDGLLQWLEPMFAKSICDNILGKLKFHATEDEAIKEMIQKETDIEFSQMTSTQSPTGDQTLKSDFETPQPETLNLVWDSKTKGIICIIDEKFSHVTPVNKNSNWVDFFRKKFDKANIQNSSVANLKSEIKGMKTNYAMNMLQSTHDNIFGINVNHDMFKKGICYKEL